MNSSSIINWIKKLFTLQFFSLIVGAVAAYFAYVSFVQSKPPQLNFYMDREIGEDKVSYDLVNEIYNFYGLYFYEIPPMELGYSRGVPMGHQMPFVWISNDQDKALSNFNCNISIWHDKHMASFDEPYFHLGNNMKITENTDYHLNLEYEKDILPAGSSLPMPFPYLLLMSKDGTSNAMDGKYDVTFKYRITCDGCSSPPTFFYYIRFLNSSKYTDRKSALKNFAKEIIYEKNHFCDKSMLIYINQFGGYQVGNDRQTLSFELSKNTTIDELYSLVDNIVETDGN